MAVYIDDARFRYGRMQMCHMIADSREELEAMAKRIGLASKWVQFPGTWKEHYDVCLQKRIEAVRAGALLIGTKALGLKLLARKIAERRSAESAVKGGA